MPDLATPNDSPCITLFRIYFLHEFINMFFSFFSPTSKMLVSYRHMGALLGGRIKDLYLLP